MDYKHFLISLADEFDRDGEFNKADQVDENFDEFLKLLEEGKLQFDNTFFIGCRDPRLQRGNLGRETTVSGISESQ